MSNHGEDLQRLIVEQAVASAGFTGTWDDPPEYKNEEPSEDFPEEEPLEEVLAAYERGVKGVTAAPQDEEYRKLLDHAQQALYEVNQKLHDYMMALAQDGADGPALSGPGEQQFYELHILTSHIHALTKTITIYQKHAYPPI